MVELLALVNEQDKVIGKVKKEDLLKGKYIHRSSLVMLFNSKGGLLLQKRAKTKKLNPDVYDFSVTGSVRYNESYIDCAKRELREELEIEGLKLKKMFKYRYDDDWDKAFRMVYKLIYEGPLKTQKREISRLKFFELNRLKTEIINNPSKFSPSLCKGLEIYFEKQTK